MVHIPPEYPADKPVHYSRLLGILVVILLVYPYLEGRTSLREMLLLLVLLGTMTCALHYARRSSRDLTVGIICSVVLMVNAIVAHLGHLVGNLTSELVLSVASMILYGYTTLMVVGYVLRPKRVTNETLAAAAMAYITLSFFFLMMYETLNVLAPYSFHAAHVNNPDHMMTWSDFLYFSVATLTSTGYGDMTPLTSQARSLALLESLTGQFYMAVLVARLVGLHQIQLFEPEKHK